MEQNIQQVVIIIGVVTVVMSLFIIAIIDLLLISRNRKLKFENEMLEKDANFQAEVMKIKMEVSKETLHEISLELHDNLGQMLTLTMMQLNNGVQGDAIESLQNSINELRSISRTLNCEFDSFLLRDNLARLFERINRSGSLVANLVLPNPNFSLINSEKELFLLRILQELINNSLKHSRAEIINLVIDEDEHNYLIKYADTGVGFDEEEKKLVGIGLNSIENRCKILNAEFEIETSKNKGFKFKMILPK